MKKWEKTGIVLHICNSNVFNGRGLKSPMHFCTICQHVAFISVYEENLASHRYVVRKGSNILIVFSDNCECSLDITKAR